MLKTYEAYKEAKKTYDDFVTAMDDGTGSKKLEEAIENSETLKVEYDKQKALYDAAKGGNEEEL